ncbi:MAG: hypothetical protein LV481_09520 [Methylacidiphilales bacterium]|nr:hypothetical protein [Candidatus Methylacidiphilales bacterium]
MSSCNTAEKFNVVILYDRFTSVGRAMAAYSHLTRELESEFIPVLRIWRVDVATLPECASQADEDIEAAEMVIMAVRNVQPCPPAFVRWMEGSRGDNGCGLTKRALIAIIEAPDQAAPSADAWNTFARGEAQAQLDVLFWAPSAEASAPPAPCGATTTEPRTNALESAAIRLMKPTPLE